MGLCLIMSKYAAIKSIFYITLDFYINLAFWWNSLIKIRVFFLLFDKSRIYQKSTLIGSLRPIIHFAFCAHFSCLMCFWVFVKASRKIANLTERKILLPTTEWMGGWVCGWMDGIVNILQGHINPGNVWWP